MSKELCSRTLTSAQMSRISSVFPDIDWTALFALIQKHGSSVIQIVDDIATFMQAPTLGGLLNLIRKDGETMRTIIDDLIAVLHPGGE